MKKPIIGITPSPADHDFSQSVFNSDYTAAVEAAGGIPVVLPPQYGDIDELLTAVDGLLLTGGGGDVGPSRYGDDTVHPATGDVHDRRDDLEFALVHAALGRDLPLLCICRGSQILNVALGGTLYQDIPDQHGRDIEHSQSKIGIDFNDPSHTVTAEPGSLLARVYDATTIEVNSDHHQASKRVGSELRAAGRASDGIIESVERPGSRFVLGIQWHPELMFRAHSEHLRPFSALVAAAAEFRQLVAVNVPVAEA